MLEMGRSMLEMGRRNSHVQGCSCFPAPPPGLPSPSHRFRVGGSEDPGPDPEYKAVPAIGALDSRCVACGQSPEGGRHLRRTCLAAAPRTAPPGGPGAGRAKRRELGAGGTFSLRAGCWAPAKGARKPPPVRAGAQAQSWADPPVAGGWLVNL